MTLKQNLVTFLLLLTGMASVCAQSSMPKIPIDPNVRIGHLSNGLTYYIRHNDYPAHVASFYIAQKVGSINENDDQRGLAHLLEHMAFNGTDHFKDNDLQEYLQSIGVEYGRNLNAYTGIDQTVYYFTDVPTTRLSAVDSCMMILKDWSHGITLSKKAIDGERDVVHNEYRMRMSAQQRMLERALPSLYPGSKYGYRMPIGLMSVVDKSNPNTLRAYYQKWYRPDNQAIIVVGDVDVNHIEGQIKALFGDIKVPANAPKVIPEKVPDNDQPIYVVEKDKEQQVDVIATMIKHDATPDSAKNSMLYMVQNFIKGAVGSMLSSRYAELSQEPNCPYLQAGASYGEYLMSRTKDAFTIDMVPKTGQLLQAYQAVLDEAKRVRDFGFTATEYERYKANFMSGIETAYANRNKMKNEQFTGQYVGHFISNEPIPSVEQEYQIDKMLMPNIPLQVVNEMARQLISVSDTNFVTLVMMQEKPNAVYPTVQQLKDVVAKVRNTKLTAYVDHVKNEPLIAKLPKAGKIEKESEDNKLGFKELTLSNGAHVYLKKTDFKDNEIQFYAKAKGGQYAFPKSHYLDISMAAELLNASGLGNFSNTELSKALAGKEANANFFIGTYNHGLSGASTPKDLETLMQLVYLEMTDVAKDEKSVNNFKDALATQLQNQSKNPQSVFSDSLSSTLYKGNALFMIPKSSQIAGINYDWVLQTAKELYSNASDFNYYFVGNFDEDKLRPLLEQYIASLPATGKKSDKYDEIPRYIGEVKNVFTQKMENPQNMIVQNWRSAKSKNSLQNQVVVDIAARLLNMKYDRSIRETLSAAYSASAESGVDENPDKSVYYNINGVAMLNPAKSAKAIPYFMTGLKETVEKPDPADLQKVKAVMLKNADVAVKTNGYWINILNGYVDDGQDFYTGYKDAVRNTTPQMISDFLKNVILKSGNHAEVLMNAIKG